MDVSQLKMEPWPVREWLGSTNTLNLDFPPSQLISATSPHLMYTHRVNWMDVIRLVLNQQSLCSQSPVDLSFLEWPEIIIDLVECGCESLVCVRNPVAIYNSSCSSFLVPKLAIKRFNWPWNVDCKLWFEKTRDSKVIFSPQFGLNMPCIYFLFCNFFWFCKDFFSCLEGCMVSYSGKALLASVLVQSVLATH